MWSRNVSRVNWKPEKFAQELSSSLCHSTLGDVCLYDSQPYSPGLQIAGPPVIDSNCCKKQSSWRKTSGVLDIVIQTPSLDESSPRHFLLSLGVHAQSCQVISSESIMRRNDRRKCFTLCSVLMILMRGTF